MVSLIRDLCAQKGTSIKALERELGMGNGTIRRWDDSRPSYVKIQMVADYFGVSVDYLLTGDTEPEEPAQVMSDEEIKLVNLFKKASPEMQAAALAILRAAEEMQQMKAQLGNEAESVAKDVAEKAAEKFDK